MNFDEPSEHIVQHWAACLAGPLTDEDVAKFLQDYDQVPDDFDKAALVTESLERARALPAYSAPVPGLHVTAADMWEPRSEVTVVVKENSFFPSEVKLLSGGRVNWTAAPGCHLPQVVELVDVSSGEVIEEITLDSGKRLQSRTFDAVGTYRFQSNVYTFMRGSVSVSAATSVSSQRAHPKPGAPAAQRAVVPLVQASTAAHVLSPAELAAAPPLSPQSQTCHSPQPAAPQQPGVGPVPAMSTGAVRDSLVNVTAAAASGMEDSSDDEPPSLVHRLQRRYAPHATPEEMMPLLQQGSVTSIHTPSSRSALRAASASPAASLELATQLNSAPDTPLTQPHFYPGQDYQPSLRTIAGGTLDLLQDVDAASLQADAPLRVLNSQRNGTSSRSTSPSKAAHSHKRLSNVPVVDKSSSQSEYEQENDGAERRAPRGVSRSQPLINGAAASQSESDQPPHAYEITAKSMLSALNLGRRGDSGDEVALLTAQLAKQVAAEGVPHVTRPSANTTASARSQASLPRLSTASNDLFQQVAELDGVLAGSSRSPDAGGQTEPLQSAASRSRAMHDRTEQARLALVSEQPAAELRRRRVLTSHRDQSDSRNISVPMTSNQQVHAALGRWGGSRAGHGEDGPGDSLSTFMADRGASRSYSARRLSDSPASAISDSEVAGPGSRSRSGWTLRTFSRSGTTSAETSGSDAEEHAAAASLARRRSTSRGMATDGGEAGRAAPTTRSIGVSTTVPTASASQSPGLPASRNGRKHRTVSPSSFEPDLEQGLHGYPSAAEDAAVLAELAAAPKLDDRLAPGETDEGVARHACRSKQCRRRDFLSGFNSMRCSAQHSSLGKKRHAPELGPIKQFWAGLTLEQASALVHLAADATGRRLLRAVNQVSALADYKAKMEAHLDLDSLPQAWAEESKSRAPASSQYAAAGRLLHGLAFKGLRKPLSADLLFKWLQEAAEGTLLYAFPADHVPWQVEPSRQVGDLEAVLAAHLEVRLVNAFHAHREESALRHQQELEAAEEAAKLRAESKKAKRRQKGAQRKGPVADAGPADAAALPSAALEEAASAGDSALNNLAEWEAAPVAAEEPEHRASVSVGPLGVAGAVHAVDGSEPVSPVVVSGTASAAAPSDSNTSDVSAAPDSRGRPMGSAQQHAAARRDSHGPAQAGRAVVPASSRPVNAAQQHAPPGELVLSGSRRSSSQDRSSASCAPHSRAAPENGHRAGSGASASTSRSSSSADQHAERSQHDAGRDSDWDHESDRYPSPQFQLVTKGSRRADQRLRPTANARADVRQQGRYDQQAGRAGATMPWPHMPVRDLHQQAKRQSHQPYPSAAAKHAEHVKHWQPVPSSRQAGSAQPVAPTPPLLAGEHALPPQMTSASGASPAMTQHHSSSPHGRLSVDRPSVQLPSAGSVPVHYAVVTPVAAQQPRRAGSAPPAAPPGRMAATQQQRSDSGIPAPVPEFAASSVAVSATKPAGGVKGGNACLRDAASDDWPESVHSSSSRIAAVYEPAAASGASQACRSPAPQVDAAISTHLPPLSLPVVPGSMADVLQTGPPSVQFGSAAETSVQHTEQHQDGTSTSYEQVAQPGHPQQHLYMTHMHPLPTPPARYHAAPTVEGMDAEHYPGPLQPHAHSHLAYAAPVHPHHAQHPQHDAEVPDAASFCVHCQSGVPHYHSHPGMAQAYMPIHSRALDLPPIEHGVSWGFPVEPVPPHIAARYGHIAHSSMHVMPHARPHGQHDDQGASWADGTDWPEQAYSADHPVQSAVQPDAFCHHQQPEWAAGDLDGIMHECMELESHLGVSSKGSDAQVSDADAWPSGQDADASLPSDGNHEWQEARDSLDEHSSAPASCSGQEGVGCGFLHDLAQCLGYPGAAAAAQAFHLAHPLRWPRFAGGMAARELWSRWHAAHRASSMRVHTDSLDGPGPAAASADLVEQNGEADATDHLPGASAEPSSSEQLAAAALAVTLCAHDASEAAARPGIDSWDAYITAVEDDGVHSCGAKGADGHMQTLQTLGDDPSSIRRDPSQPASGSSCSQPAANGERPERWGTGECRGRPAATYRAYSSGSSSRDASPADRVKGGRYVQSGRGMGRGRRGRSAWPGQGPRTQHWSVIEGRARSNGRAAEHSSMHRSRGELSWQPRQD